MDLLQRFAQAREEWKNACDKNMCLFYNWMSIHSGNTDCAEYKEYLKTTETYNEKLAIMESICKEIEERLVTAVDSPVNRDNSGNASDNNESNANTNKKPKKIETEEDAIDRAHSVRFSNAIEKAVEAGSLTRLKRMLNSPHSYLRERGAYLAALDVGMTGYNSTNKEICKWLAAEYPAEFESGTTPFSSFEMPEEEEEI